jgi:hypothetical protein
VSKKFFEIAVLLTKKEYISYYLSSSKLCQSDSLSPLPNLNQAKWKKVRLFVIHS